MSNRRAATFGEAPIRQAMAADGFFRVRPMVYKHVVSPGAPHHFLWFEMWGTPKRYLSSVYGFGNADADRFVSDCLRRYGGQHYQQLATDGPNEPLVRFSFGAIAGWEPRGSIDIRVISKDAVKKRISASLQSHVAPVILKLKTVAELLLLLRSDEHPFGWAYSNAAARAAYVAYLGLQCGMTEALIRESMQPFKKHIGAQITGGVRPEEYMDNVISNARAVAAGVPYGA